MKLNKEALVLISTFLGARSELTYLLIEPMIRFRIRIRETDQISDGQKRLAASIMFAHLQPGQREILSGRRWVWGRAGIFYKSARILSQKMLKPLDLLGQKRLKTLSGIASTFIQQALNKLLRHRNYFEFPLESHQLN